MDKKDRKKSYSDLEAIVTSSFADRQSYWNAKFAVPSTPDPPHRTDGANEGKAAHDAKAFFDTSPVDTLAPAPPAYFLVDSKGQTQALYTAPTNTPSDTSSIVNFKGGIPVAASSPGPSGWWSSLGEGKKICGMRKNVFLAVMAGVCALVLGLLVTVLLVTHPKGDRGDGDKPDGTKPVFSTEMLLDKGDAGSFLAASNIAAMNWTTAGVSYTGVFYQSSAASGAGLMVAVQNAGTQAWITVNISASVTGKGLDVLPGTPLAAASNNGLWNLYYVTSGMTIEEVYSTDPTSSSGWLQGEFAVKLGHPEIMPSSGLGAMWQSCDDCDDALVVMWQNAQSGSLVYANMTNLTWGSSPVVISGSAAPGTPAAVNAFTDTGKSQGSDHDAIRFYWTQGNILQETLKGPLGNGKLVPGNKGGFTSYENGMEESDLTYCVYRRTYREQPLIKSAANAR